MEIKKFDILQVDFSDVVGCEQGGIRPCVVIQNDTGNRYSSTHLVALMTKELKKLNQPTHALVKKDKAVGLTSDSMVLCEQIRTIDKVRIKEKRGCIVDDEVKNDIAMSYVANFTGKKMYIPEICNS